jgi:hypothetical protein
MISIDGQSLAGATALAVLELLTSHAPAEPALVTFERNGMEQSVAVMLGPLRGRE